MEQGPLGLNPELRTPPLPATHVRAGTGHRVLARNYTTDKVGPPTCEFTRDVRPRVATSSGSSPPPTWPTSWTDSTDTNKPRHPTVPIPRPPDPRRTHKPDHLEVGATRGQGASRSCSAATPSSSCSPPSGATSCTAIGVPVRGWSPAGTETAGLHPRTGTPMAVQLVA